MVNQTADINSSELFSLLKSCAVTMGGHRKLKIYGKMNCSNAKRWIDKGHYIAQRVFFKDQTEAIENGYRPCGCCMKKEYQN